MERLSKEDFNNKNFITCKCGKQNLTTNASVYGTCSRCGKQIDKRAIFKNKLNDMLGLWKKNRNLHERFILVSHRRNRI